MNIYLPTDVKYILEKLDTAGFSAYLVGGSLRDSLMGDEPHDFDIATSAKPPEIKAVFCHEHLIETGIQHGTLTLVKNGITYEITTFRRDGEYLDARRPENVTFTDDLAEDLARRDFTMNALAYNKTVGLVDIFSGTEHINAKKIVCVGDANDRLSEDALRIMRALRFSATLGFRIDDSLKLAIFDRYKSLEKVSIERINIEFTQLIMGKYASDILREYAEVFSFFIPELAPMYGFNQHNKYHKYDVWEHSLHVLDNVPNDDLCLRLAALFHDIGKPDTYYLDENSVGHFYGHEKVSAEITDKILRRLRYSIDVRNEAVSLVSNHAEKLGKTKKDLLRLLNKYGEEGLRKLLKLKLADSASKNEDFPRQNQYIREYQEFLDTFDLKNECFLIKHLAINGDDLIKLGMKPSKKFAEILELCLIAVIDGEVKNEKSDLLDFVKNLL